MSIRFYKDSIQIGGIWIWWCGFKFSDEAEEIYYSPLLFQHGRIIIFGVLIDWHSYTKERRNEP